MKIFVSNALVLSFLLLHRGKKIDKNDFVISVETPRFIFCLIKIQFEEKVAFLKRFFEDLGIYEN